jgi:hypothetical protein
VELDLIVNGLGPEDVRPESMREAGREWS